MKSELRAYVEKHLHDTEVFCFQEAALEDRMAYEALLADNFMLHSAQRRQTGGGWYGNAIYARKGIAVLKNGSLFTAGADGFDVGIAAFLTLQLSDVELTICNVHGVPRPGHKLDTPDRLYQSKMILDTFKDNQAVIIGGDFNLLPHTQSIQTFVEHGYRNLVTDFEIKTTRNRISYEKYPNAIQYYADYAFVSPSIKVIDFVVPGDLVSDHQPLELTFDCLVPSLILQPDSRPQLALA
ncbi:endonuclease/exonuclease/phosphatase family protein [Candidatus Saccharibacteria bacterium]|nr:endonuclease/exonuclease/phosphatase family protein [Candidatus Saccharibacteria bacterium]